MFIIFTKIPCPLQYCSTNYFVSVFSSQPSPKNPTCCCAATFFSSLPAAPLPTHFHGFLSFVCLRCLTLANPFISLSSVTSGRCHFALVFNCLLGHPPLPQSPHNTLWKLGVSNKMQIYNLCSMHATLLEEVTSH